MSAKEVAELICAKPPKDYTKILYGNDCVEILVSDDLIAVQINNYKLGQRQRDLSEHDLMLHELMLIPAEATRRLASWANELLKSRGAPAQRHSAYRLVYDLTTLLGFSFDAVVAQSNLPAGYPFEEFKELEEHFMFGQYAMVDNAGQVTFTSVLKLHQFEVELRNRLIYGGYLNLERLCYEWRDMVTELDSEADQVQMAKERFNELWRKQDAYFLEEAP